MSRLTLRLVLAQGLDAATFLGFYLGIGAAVHAERNPLILAIMALAGLQGVAIVKVGLALLVSWRRAHRVRPIGRRYAIAETIALSTATASGIVGAGFNTAAIVHATTGFAIRLPAIL